MAKPTLGQLRVDGPTLIADDGYPVAVCRQAKPRNSMEARANAEKLARRWNEHPEIIAEALYWLQHPATHDAFRTDAEMYRKLAASIEALRAKL